MLSSDPKYDVIITTYSTSGVKSLMEVFVEDADNVNSFTGSSTRKPNIRITIYIQHEDTIMKQILKTSQDSGRACKSQPKDASERGLYGRPWH